jgi:transcriptional regulator with XRE-family HTH domain
MSGARDSVHNPGRVAFGARVRELRLAKGLSQEELAERAGLHRTYLSSLERGQRNVGLDNILDLAAALEVPPARLFQDT